MASILTPQTRGSSRPAADASRQGILVLSSSILTDRVLIYTDVLQRLRRAGPVTVWTLSADAPGGPPLWAATGATVEKFPAVRELPLVPHILLRRVNDYTWDFHIDGPSRKSAQRHIRDRQQAGWLRAFKSPARVLAKLGLETALETGLERLVLGFQRSEEGERRLRELNPKLVVTTGPFFFNEPAVSAAARRLGIPILAMIPSWDNLSTKSRMVIRYDGYVVWSEEERRQLHQYYPESRSLPVFAVGAPQFDLFHQARFQETREQFCSRYGFRADLPIVVHAIGSPNFIKERYAAAEVARRVSLGELGDVQLLIRPHPIHDDSELAALFPNLDRRLAVQSTSDAAGLQNEEQIIEWINTFRHADVVLNLASTVTVDAALFDRPVVNMDFDPEPGAPNQGLVEDLNHRWTHFKPVAESGGVWLVRDFDETMHALRTYLRQPELHREQRRWITEFVCGRIDGKSAPRLADAVLEFLANRNAQPAEVRAFAAMEASMDSGPRAKTSRG